MSSTELVPPVAQLDTQLMYAVNRDSPAFAAVLKICKQPIKPGMVIPLSQEEFDALKDDVLVLAIPAP